jgi:predicted MFS family arabinose efflux permease
MFMSTSPVTIAILQSAHARHASFAMALQIFVSHILGDALSAPLIGRLSDATGDLRLGMLACAPMLLLSAFLWYWPTRQRH